MSLLVVGGSGLYFGTLYVLGMRLHELRVRAAGASALGGDGPPVR
jgi:hypothetical protein